MSSRRRVEEVELLGFVAAVGEWMTARDVAERMDVPVGCVSRALADFARDGVLARRKYLDRPPHYRLANGDPEAMRAWRMRRPA